MASLGHDVLEGAVACLHREGLFEEAGKSFPRVVLGELGFGDGGEFGHDVFVELVDQVVLVGVATVDSADADAGALGDLVEGRLKPALGEGRECSLEDLLPVAFGVARSR